MTSHPTASRDDRRAIEIAIGKRILLVLLKTLTVEEGRRIRMAKRGLTGGQGSVIWSVF
jgi:hypothetical protein